VKTPRAFLAPSFYPPDRYRNSLMTACQPSTENSSPFFTLYNNGQRGRYLFLYGLQLWTNFASADTLFGAFGQGIPASSTAVVTLPIKQDEPTGEGVCYYGTGAGGFPAGVGYVLGSTIGGFYKWDALYPLAIIPPGQNFGITYAAASVTWGASMQWYAGEPDDRMPLITMDVEDFAL
jgi:hypothetical protein